MLDGAESYEGRSVRRRSRTLREGAEADAALQCGRPRVGRGRDVAFPVRRAVAELALVMGTVRPRAGAPTVWQALIIDLPLVSAPVRQVERFPPHLAVPAARTPSYRPDAPRPAKLPGGASWCCMSRHRFSAASSARYRPTRSRQRPSPASACGVPFAPAIFT